MKIIKWAALVVLLVAVVAGLLVYFNLNGIVRSTVEKQSTASLDLKTDLESANLALFGGSLSLDDLRIASPEGFTAPAMFSLDDVKLDVDYGQLRKDPIRISNIEIRKPTLVVEQANGKFNFQAVMDKASKEGESDGDGQRKEGEPIRLIIDHLLVSNASVVIRPGIPGLANEFTVPIPSLELNNVGTGEGNQNGAAIKEVVMEVITALAGKATDAGNLPDQLKEQLNNQITAVAGKLSAEFNKQLGQISDEIGKQLPGELGEAVGGALKDVKLDGKEPGKAVEEGLQGLLGGKKKEKPERDSDRDSDPAIKPDEDEK